MAVGVNIMGFPLPSGRLLLVLSVQLLGQKRCQVRDHPQGLVLEKQQHTPAVLEYQHITGTFHGVLTDTNHQ